LTPVRAERSLAPCNATDRRRRIVAAQDAVAIQRTPAPAVRAAPSFKRKSTALNSSSSRMN
jgi:hypothetical protein